jgi:hypothetical protein
VEVLLE